MIIISSNPKSAVPAGAYLSWACYEIEIYVFCYFSLYDYCFANYIILYIYRVLQIKNGTNNNLML
jgi:hypothetical protein